MIENIDKVLERGDRLELLVDKTENLQGNTFRFRKQTRRFRSTVWWKNVKLTYVLTLKITIFNSFLHDIFTTHYEALILMTYITISMVVY